MNTSAYVIAPAPRSPLAQQLDYQIDVHAVLRATTRRVGPLLTAEERVEMEQAYTLGISPAAFAATLIARDKAGAS